MSSALAKIRCPNPEHNDSNPSCAVYEDGLYCFSRCGRISWEQLEDWVTPDEYRSIRRNEAGTGSGQRIQRPRGNGLPEWNERQGPIFIRICHRILLEGYRQTRQEWFLQRGFSQRDLLRWQFGHTGTHFVIPLWSGDHTIGYKLRRDECYCDPDSPKYLIPSGQSSLVIDPNPSGSPTIVVEGELDAYLLAGLGANAITTTTGSGTLLSLWESVYRLPRPIYLLPDTDEVGIRNMQKLQERLTELSVENHWIDCPNGGDTTDYLLRFPTEDRINAMRQLMGVRHG